MINPELQGVDLDFPVVPRAYGGKWIAWNHAGTKILAADDDLYVLKVWHVKLANPDRGWKKFRGATRGISDPRKHE